MDYEEMINFITEQFIENNYGVFIKDGNVFNYFIVYLVPSGIDIEMHYRPIGKCCPLLQYAFEKGRTVREAMEASSEVMVDTLFWRWRLEGPLYGFADACFGCFKDWTARSVFKTDDTIHVRFEVPEPMSEEGLIKWVRSSCNSEDYVFVKINPGRFALEFPVD